MANRAEIMIRTLFRKKFNFWRENGRGRHAGAKGSRGSRPDQKVGSSGGIFWSTVISEKSFRAEIKYCSRILRKNLRWHCQIFNFIPVY